MELIDTHAHLYLPHFADDIEQVIENAAGSNVSKILLPNIDGESVAPMLALYRRFPEHCKPMIGLHPTAVVEDFREKLSFIESLVYDKDFIAIGETGLDAYWDKTFLKEQELSFIAHIDWAAGRGIPLVIHSRNTMERIIEIIGNNKRSGLTGVFHAFSGTLDQAEKIVGFGFKLGIGGVVTYKNSGILPVIRTIGLDHFVLETDSPYLTPVPKRGKRNESANLPLIAEKIALIKDVAVEEVARKTTENATCLFRL
jgi:TatD DNase family protein